MGTLPLIPFFFLPLGLDHTIKWILLRLPLFPPKVLHAIAVCQSHSPLSPLLLSFKCDWCKGVMNLRSFMNAFSSIPPRIGLSHLHSTFLLPAIVHDPSLFGPLGSPSLCVLPDRFPVPCLIQVSEMMSLRPRKNSLFDHSLMI